MKRNEQQGSAATAEPGTGSLADEIRRLEGEIASREQELAELDARAAQIVLTDADAASECDARVEGLRRTVGRLRAAIQDLEQKQREEEVRQEELRIETAAALAEEEASAITEALEQKLLPLARAWNEVHAVRLEGNANPFVDFLIPDGPTFLDLLIEATRTRQIPGADGLPRDGQRKSVTQEIYADLIAVLRQRASARRLQIARAAASLKRALRDDGERSEAEKELEAVQGIPLEDTLAGGDLRDRFLSKVPTK